MNKSQLWVIVQDLMNMVYSLGYSYLLKDEIETINFADGSPIKSVTMKSKE